MQLLAPGLARARQSLFAVAVALLAVFALGGSQASSAQGVAKHLSAIASAGPGQSGVVAAYSFDANGGATVADDTGHGHIGTVSGATWTGSGRSGGALSFDGYNDLVTIADANALDLSSGMTLEAWVNPRSLGRSWRSVLVKQKPNGIVYSLYANQNRGIPVGQVDIGGEQSAAGGSSLPRNAWTHLATTYDGSTLRLYRNGILSASRTVAGAIAASSGPLQIGGNTIWWEWFSGSIDDVRVYDRALSAVEVQTDMSTPVGTGPPTDGQAPSTPSNLRTSGQNQTAITLAWNASTDNVGVAGYGRYRNDTILSSQAGATHTFTGLGCGTTYTLAVDAYDAAGNRSGRASVTASTSACSTADTTPPSAPGNLSTSGQTQTAITLNWSAASDNVGVAGYGYYRAGALVANGNGVSYTFYGLACGTSYTLAVDAYDAAGNRSARPAITASTSACPPPAGVPGPVAAYSFDAGSGSSLADASGNGNTGTISGAAWSSGRFGGALSFDGANDWVTVADASSLDLTTGMTLQAWVRPSTLRRWPTVVTKETSGNLVYGLFANSDVNQPSGIATIANSPLQSITRGPSALPAGTWTHLATTYDGATLRMYVNGTQVSSDPVTGAMANTSGPLRIGGNSVWPEWFEGQIDELRIYNRPLSASELQTDMTTPVGGGSAADTLAPSAPAGLSAGNQTQTAITLSWTAASDNVGVTGYSYYRAGSLVENGSGTSYTFTGLACGTSYALAVDAYDAAGNRSTRPSINASTSACTTADTTPPSAPGNLSASGQTQTAITLSWSTASDNVGVTGYGYYRGTTLVGSGAGTSYTFNGLTCNTSYTLAVDAYDAAGNRSTRPSVNATTSACAAPPPTGTGTANLWVDTSGGSCVRQSARAGWVDAQGCSWNAAYQAAQTGDLILVKGGSYGNVSIGPNKASIGAPGVTFQTNTGESVTVDNLENGHIAAGTGGSNVTFVGPATSRTFRSDRADNVVVDGWNVDCGGCVNVQTFHVEAANNFTVKNSEISDNTDNSLIWISGSNLTFENNRIHDAGLRGGSGAHTECMYAWSVTNLTLKRNHFYHCGVMDVFITGSSVANGGYVENNIFEKPWSTTGNIGGGLAFHFRNGGSPPTPDPNDWDFRYNTFVGPLSITTDANPVGSGGMRLIGNVFLAGAPSCGLANTSWSHNAFTGGGCGANSITNSLSGLLAGFTSAGDPGDYSLNAGSVLRDKGNPSSFPATDRTGGARYTGAAPDIGAYEYR